MWQARRGIHLPLGFIREGEDTSGGGCRAEVFVMSDEPKALHVSPTGENWEVESSVGSVAQAETKHEAIEAAREAAAEHQAEAIIVHTYDGMVEQEIRLTSPKNETK